MNLVREQLDILRFEAGAAYRQAASLYVQAWTSLRSVELAISTLNLDSDEMATLMTPPMAAAHAEFLPDAAHLYGTAHQRARDNCDELLAAISARQNGQTD